MKYILSLALLLICSAGFSQNRTVTKLDGSQISPAEIDQTVERLMKAAAIPGLDLAILNKRKTVFIKSYGYKNELSKQLLDTASIVYAASFSKAIFGYLTMKLVQEKKIDLDKPLYQYLRKPIPEYEYFSELAGDERWKLITARMCLSHTTGLPNIKQFNPTGVPPEFDSLGKMKIYFTPGTKYAYSGEALKLLQLVEEEITGRTLDELAVEKVFAPMGMNRTGYIWHDNFGDDLAIGHSEQGDQNIKRKRTVAVAGGSVVTTIADYARFIEHMQQQKGLERKWFEEMISPQIDIYSKTQFPPLTFDSTMENRDIHLAYGLGWGLMKTKYGRAFFKEGGDDAWKNYNINFLDKGISIIIITNSVHGSKIFKELLETLIGDTFTPWRWEEYYPYNYKK